VASSWCPGPLLLQVALVWARFVVMLWVQQYVLAVGDPVVVVTADRVDYDVTEVAMWACSARVRVSSLATSAVCVLASAMAMLDAP
jgi:hypothetical protein